MGSFGIGQGLNEGVKTATQAILSAAELKQRQKQFDDQREFRNRYLVAMMGFRMGASGGDGADPGAATGGDSLSFPPPSQPEDKQMGNLRVPGMQPFRGPKVGPASPGQSARPSSLSGMSPGALLRFSRGRRSPF